MDPATLALLGAGGSGLLKGLGSFLGANSQARAAKRAAEESNRILQQGIDFQKGVYSDAQGNLNPYIDAGTRGLGGYEDAIKNFTKPTFDFQKKDFALDNWKDPGYDFRLSEAEKAIQGSAAAKGGALGSGALKSLQTRGQDMASQEYQNSFNRFQTDDARKFNEALGIYDRDYAFGKDNIANYGNLANMGSGAATALMGGGNTAVSNMMPAYGSQAGNAGTAKMAQGQANSAGWNNLFSGLGGLGSDFTKYLGSYGGGTELPNWAGSYNTNSGVG